ncbi:MAG: MerR family transcriptional regulator [Stackebrandtia sp.]
MTTLTAPTSGHSIGEASRRSGFSMDTLRYYEKIGLLVDIERSSTGHRCFSDADLSWLGMLKCLRDTGMPVAEMLKFAELVRAGDHTIGERIHVLEDHHRRLVAHIAHLRDEQNGITAKIDFYKSHRLRPRCSHTGCHASSASASG